MKTKIIAMYLPQYHETEENNQWWGKGFTDWVSTKNAEVLFKGHRQPRIPLEDNYYRTTKAAIGNCAQVWYRWILFLSLLVFIAVQNTYKTC